MVWRGLSNVRKPVTECTPRERISNELQNRTSSEFMASITTESRRPSDPREKQRPPETRGFSSRIPRKKSGRLTSSPSRAKRAGASREGHADLRRARYAVDVWRGKNLEEWRTVVAAEAAGTAEETLPVVLRSATPTDGDNDNSRTRNSRTRGTHPRHRPARRRRALSSSHRCL